MKRNVYLESVSLEEALARWAEATRDYRLGNPVERVAVAQSLGRVTATPVFAAVSSPFYHASAMDGYAVRAADTFGAAETSPRRLRLAGEAVPVDTGDPLPEDCDAVIMIEDVNPISPGEIEIIAPIAPWRNVRVVGEDIVATELILPENHQIGPADLGAMLAAGLVEVDVRRRPRLAILPTGTELVEPGAALARGAIIEFNSHVLGALAANWGADVQRWRPLPDDYAALKKAVGDAVAQADVVVINAGSSAGSEDFTRAILGDLGQVLVHGVKIRPGKPVVLALVGGRPVLGIPGYPVSAMLTFELFGKPLLAHLSGLRLPARPQAAAFISQKVASPLGAEEFLRVKLGRVGGRLIAAPIGRGAAVIMSMVRADGVVRVPATSEGLLAGQEVAVELLKSLEEVNNTVVAIGSHDPVLDVLANELKKTYPEMNLSSAHVGSMGGLMALKRGEAHLAGTHLLDEESGEYNVPFLRRLLPEKRIVLVNLVYRQQGLIVPPGNPKLIRGFADLTRPGVTFINRQRGSGTRLLLDYRLREAGVTSEQIAGYNREEYTHMAVAAAVASGAADVGLGVLSAARALGLDFLPVGKERYDLAIPAEHFQTPLLQRVLAIIRSPEFQRQVLALGGYETEATGEVLAET